MKYWIFWIIARFTYDGRAERKAYIKFMLRQHFNVEKYMDGCTRGDFQTYCASAALSFTNDLHEE